MLSHSDCINAPAQSYGEGLPTGIPAACHLGEMSLLLGGYLSPGLTFRRVSSSDIDESLPGSNLGTAHRQGEDCGPHYKDRGAHIWTSRTLTRSSIRASTAGVALYEMAQVDRIVTIGTDGRCKVDSVTEKAHSIKDFALPLDKRVARQDKGEQESVRRTSFESVSSFYTAATTSFDLGDEDDSEWTFRDAMSMLPAAGATAGEQNL